MANSKHAHLRYNTMDYCFQKKSLTFNQLLEHINREISGLYPGEEISVKTLRNDIKLFRDPIIGFGAPLDDMSRTYSYSEPNFSIASKALLPYENYLIEASQQLLERFENHPKYDKLAEALIKFQVGEDQETETSKILFYDHNEEYKGVKYLKPLYLAIQKKQVLKVTYKGFKDTSAKIFEFHPHVLKQYNRRWFAYGLNNTNGNSEWSIPLDERLIDFILLENTNYLDSDNDWHTFFRTMVGVIRPINVKIERVVLRFYNGRGDYFKTKPFHPDYDEFLEDDKQDQIWFDTIINQELVQQLLSYGQDVEVLEPKKLKEKLKEHAIKLNEFYNM